jgi:hypothetical protein
VEPHRDDHGLNLSIFFFIVQKSKLTIRKTKKKSDAKIKNPLGASGSNFFLRKSLRETPLAT